MFHQGRILYTSLVSLIMKLICLDPCQWSLMSLITGNKVKKKTHKPRYCETFINIWITKVKLFWKKRGVGVLTLQYNSYLSHVRSFFKISSNFLSLISSYIFCAIFFIHLKPRVESFWGVLSWCLTPPILFNFRYKKIKTYG
jgi:hypothetical protein